MGRSECVKAWRETAAKSYTITVPSSRLPRPKDISPLLLFPPTVALIQREKGLANPFPNKAGIWRDRRASNSVDKSASAATFPHKQSDGGWWWWWVGG